MIHNDKIEGYEGTIESLAKSISNMRYDMVADFLAALTEELNIQAEADRKRGRKQLSGHLLKTANAMRSSVLEMRKVWDICERFMG